MGLSQSIRPMIFYCRDRIKILSADEIWFTLRILSKIIMYMMRSNRESDIWNGVQNWYTSPRRSTTCYADGATERDLLHHDMMVMSLLTKPQLQPLQAWTLIFMSKFRRLILALGHLKYLISVLGVSNLINFSIGRLRGRAIYTLFSNDDKASSSRPQGASWQQPVHQ
jgi:hypothetical protein